jgi:membrane protein YqaA with SNARE-associated domain
VLSRVINNFLGSFGNFSFVGAGGLQVTSDALRGIRGVRLRTAAGSRRSGGQRVPGSSEDVRAWWVLSCAINNFLGSFGNFSFGRAGGLQVTSDPLRGIRDVRQRATPFSRRSDGQWVPGSSEDVRACWVLSCAINNFLGSFGNFSFGRAGGLQVSDVSF